MIFLENVLKTSLHNVLKMFWRRPEDVLKMSWRYLEDVFPRRLENILDVSWRCLEDILNMCWKRLEDVLKMSSEEMYVKQSCSSWSKRLEDVVIKTNVFWENIYNNYPAHSKIFRKTQICKSSTKQIHFEISRRGQILWMTVLSKQWKW